MATLPGSGHHPSSHGTSASVRGGIGQRWGLDPALRFATLLALRSSRHYSLVARCVFMSINKFIMAMKLVSPASALRCPVLVGGSSGRGCVLPHVCVPVFLGDSGFADFLHLDFSAMVVSRLK